MTVPEIKIYELPSKHRQDVNGSEYMVIDDGIDTKKITVEELQLIFSADNKISALSTHVEKIISAALNEISQLEKSIANKLSTYEGSVSDLSAQIEDAKRQIGVLQESILKHDKSIEEFTTHFNTLDKSIETIKNSIQTNSSNISNLTKQVNANTNDIITLKNSVNTDSENITNLTNELATLKKTVSDNYTTLNKKITDLDDKLTKYIDKKYEDAVKYIDYYHHIHENPPNFDEAYTGEDPISLNYIYPIGSIYQTSNADFDPDLHFPGVWKYCGLGTAHDDEGIEQVQYYTFIRIE